MLVNHLHLLNDLHIFDFNNILKLHSSFDMQSSLMFQKSCKINLISMNSEYIQIFFSGNDKRGHWICMYYNNVLHIYDSVNAKCLKDEHKVFIKKLFPNISNLLITFEVVQSQKNFYDCGVFAIAFAASIRCNVCPCSLRYVSQLRLIKNLRYPYHNNVSNCRKSFSRICK